jgi:hypothetical protein
MPVAVVMTISCQCRFRGSLQATGTDHPFIRIDGAGGAGVCGRRFGSLFLASERIQATLEGVEAGAGVGGYVVSVGLSRLMADFAPSLFLPAEFGADPWEGDKGPEAGPCEGKSPAQLDGWVSASPLTS